MSREIESKKAVITPEGVFIIGTYDEEGRPNAMNAAWGIQSDWGEITLFLAKHRTTDNLKKTGAFTVAFGTVDTVAVSDYFGIESGNNADKIARAGVHVRRSEKVNAPVIEEYPLTLECRVKSYDDATGILVGEIVSELADEGILTDGEVDLDKLRPIIFDPAAGAYRSVGPIVGKAFGEGEKIRKGQKE